MKKIIVCSVAALIYVFSAGLAFAGHKYPNCVGVAGTCKPDADYITCVHTYELDAPTGKNEFKAWQCQWYPSHRQKCWSTMSFTDTDKKYRCYAPENDK